MSCLQPTNSLLRKTHSLMLNLCRRLTGHRLVYGQFGDPLKVLQKEAFEVPESLADDQVLVQVLVSSINPGDLNVIQGTYGHKPQLPSVAGSECAAKVLKVGKGAKDIRVGDMVQSKLSRWGTWTTHAVCNYQDLRKLPNDLSAVAACTLFLNPGTAYRMLMDFEKLNPGDFVIQNGPNSAVGQAVIQICKAEGFRTINIVRDRPDLASLKQTLQEMGADVVVTPKELRTLNLNEMTAKTGRPRLGLNCVGGEIATDMQRCLADGGTIVTYGGMSLKPLVVSTGALIFRDIKARGFWISRWQRENGEPSYRRLSEYLAEAMRRNKLRPPLHQLVPFDEYETAIANCGAPLQTKKQILLMADAV